MLEQEETKQRGLQAMFWTQELADKLVEAVKTGIILTNSGGEILFTNRLALDLLGYSDASLIGRSVEELFLSDDATFFLPNIMKLNTTDSGFEGEALLRRSNGTTFFVNLSTALYRGDSLQHELIIFTFQDITHLKRMEKEYLDSERFAGLGMMTDHISHQIRNPIVSIGGFALRLAKDRISNEEYSQYSQIIHAEAKRLEHIIDRLAEFTRVQVIRHQSLTLSEIFRATAVTFDRPLERKGVRLVFSDPESLPVIPLFGDLSLLVRALELVIMNGIEAIEGEGEILVDAEIVGNQALVRVTDNGTGISVEHLPFVFDPFFSTRPDRVGLGLTMTRRVIQEHRGRIEVSSPSGQGTSVMITLPMDRRRAIRTRLI
jgi:PAS domain S-box-containing protein